MRSDEHIPSLTFARKTRGSSLTRRPRGELINSAPRAHHLLSGAISLFAQHLTRSFRARRYELSPDLLEKQVEMLERKYGGAKARRAALIIQRAFRRYKLVHKFAAITAMAKAEKRLSRRLETAGGGGAQEWSPSHHFYQLGAPQRQVYLPPTEPPPLAAQACDQCGVDAELAIRNNFAALYRDLSQEQRQSLSNRQVFFLQ